MHASALEGIDVMIAYISLFCVTFMRKNLLAVLLFLALGLGDAKSQTKEFTPDDTTVIIERLTILEADDRKVERIEYALAENRISNKWDVEGFRNKDSRLLKDYEKIAAGLKKQGVRFKELTQKEFSELKSEQNRVVYLITDYSVKEWKNVLIVTTTFKLFSSDKHLILDESAKGILKHFRVR